MPFSPAYCVPPNSNLNLQSTQPYMVPPAKVLRVCSIPIGHVINTAVEHDQHQTAQLPVQFALLTITSSESGNAADWQCSSRILPQKIYYLRVEQKHSSVLSGPVSKKRITDTFSAGLQQEALKKLPSTPGLSQDTTAFSSPDQFHK